MLNNDIADVKVSNLQWSAGLKNTNKDTGSTWTKDQKRWKDVSKEELNKLLQGKSSLWRDMIRHFSAVMLHNWIYLCQQKVHWFHWGHNNFSHQAKY